jgi:sigma-B regulation protein RsbU (phosphoserine phosphatase)
MCARHARCWAWTHPPPGDGVVPAQIVQEGTWKTQMSAETDLIDKLTALANIAETLNRAVDVRGVLDDALARLVELMGLETGWIFLKDPAAQERWAGSGYVLAAHHNLPPALATDSAEAWAGGCACQRICNDACLNKAYNEVQCSRLASVSGDRGGLVVHASTPLHSGDRILGILNVAAPDWTAFNPESLALLTNVGGQIGVALERAQLYDLLQERRVHEQAALLDFSSQLLSRLGLDDLSDLLVEDVRRMFQADACALLLPGDDPAILEFRAASGWRSDPVGQQRLAPNDEQCGAGLVMRSQQPLLEADLDSGHSATPWSPAWLVQEGFRGHAVVPLIVDGRSVGALVIDYRHAHLLDEGEVRLLRLMANQAAIAVEKVRLYQAALKVQALEKEMALGQEIQNSLLPTCCPETPDWDLAVYYQPARLVGGDFYDLFVLPGESRCLGIVVADVAGKGVPAALFMSLSLTIIRTIALGGGSPAAVLERANELILNVSRSGLFLTACYGILDLNRGRLVYANAGHNRPLWLRAATGIVEQLDARGIVLGSLSRIELDECEVELAPGDTLLLYTDGVSEAMNVEREFFDEARLQALLARVGERSPQQLLEGIVGAVTTFAGEAPQADDMTLVAVRRRLTGA